MTLSKRQDGYLNQRIILSRLQYETHSLQTYPKSPCRFVVYPTPKLLERGYALRLVVVPCRYFPSPSPFSQPISPSPLSHIFSVAVPHILRRRIHTCCPSSTLSCQSADVFTADLFCHPHYPTSPPRLHCHPPVSMMRLSLHHLPSSCLLRRRCLSTFSVQIFFSICVVLYYTACSALLRITFLTLHSDLITTLFFSLLARLFSLSVMFSLCSDLPRFFFTCLHSALLRSDHSPQLCLLLSSCFISDMINSNLSDHSLI